MSIPVIVRLFNKVNFTDTCWEWTGSRNNSGYGQISVYRINKGTHRVSYEYFNDPIPEGLVVDHICKNIICVNPDHLETVTQKENCIRGKGTKGRVDLRKIRNNNESWCAGECKDFLFKENFYKDKNRWNGFNVRCKKCQRKHNKQSYVNRCRRHET